MSKYSVFISYRRTGFETANLIAEKLRSFGYSVFFDVESLRGGKFNEQLFSVIDKCADFVVVLPEGALDRCADKEDWVRKEVTYAMLKGKNIVPVMLRGFEWPNPMPSGMEELQNYQAVTASDHETFDYAMQRLDSYLKAPKRNKVMISKVMAIVLTVVAILGILFGALRLLGRSQCENTATYLTSGAVVVHDSYEEVQQLHHEWDKYWDSRIQSITSTRRRELDEDMLMLLGDYARRTQQLRERVVPAPELTPWQTMLLGVYGTLSLEIELDAQLVSSYCDDLDSTVSLIRHKIEWQQFRAPDKQYVELEFETFDYSIGMYYASYLGQLSRFPKSAKKMHNDMCKHWTVFPALPQNLRESDYEDMVNEYLKKMTACVDEMEKLVKQTESEVDDMSMKLDSLEELANQTEQMVKLQQNTHQQREEKVELGRELIAAKKQQLSEMERQTQEVYEQIRISTKLNEEDSENYQWGKICRMAKMLALAVANRQKSARSAIDPQMVLRDIQLQIDDFIAYHPESQDYMLPLKEYYRQVSRGTIPLGGQLIFAFKDNAIHPLYQVGDIVVKRNDDQITDYSSLAAAVAKDKGGVVEFYRMAGGQLILHKENVPETTVLVGYREVGEY